MNGAAMTAMVDLWPHPLTAEGRDTRAQALAPGATVETALAAALPAPPNILAHALAVALDGRLLAAADWADTPLAPGQVLTVRTAAAGGDDSNPLQTLAAIAVLAAASAVPGMLGLSGLAAAGASAAIAVGGSLVAGALFPPAAPDTPDPRAALKAGTLYSLAGGVNLARPYAPMICVLGTHRVFPDLAARPWTEFTDPDPSDSDLGDTEQVLSQLYSFGVGDIAVSDVRIGATPLAEHHGAETETAAPGTAVTLVDPHVDTAAAGALKWDEQGEAAIAVTRTTPARTTRIALDFAARIFRIGSGGALAAHRVVVGLSIADADGAVQESFTHTLRGESGQPLRSVVTRDMPRAGVWTVTVARKEAPSDSSRVHDDVEWVQLRSYREPATAMNRGADTLYAVRITASAALQGRIEPLSALVAQRVPVWSEGAWTAERSASGNPAAVLRAWMRGWRDDAGRLLAGSGRAAAQIDDAMLGAWFEWCAARGLTCDHVVSGGTAEEVEALIARCGRAALTWQTGRLGVVWEDADDAATALITPARVIAGSMESAWASGEIADEIVVRYVDPAADWQQRDVRRRMPGAAAPAVSSVLVVPGITSPERAAEEANIQAARQRWQRRRLSWEMGRDGLAVARGDVVLVAHALVSGGETGRVAGGTAAQPVLDRAVEVPQGASILFETAEGVLHHSAAAAGDAPRAVALTALLPSAPDAETEGAGACDIVWRLYTSDDPPLRVRITAVEPLSESRVRITAVEESTAFLDAIGDDLSAPVHDSHGRVPEALRGRDGSDGYVGADGAGREYIFAVTSAASVPAAQRPSDDWGYDEGGSAGGLAWTDAAPALSANGPHLWRCERRISGAPEAGDAVADAWSAPVIVGRWGPDGAAGKPGAAGADGADGADAAGYEYVFTRSAESTLSAGRRPDDAWGYDSPGTRGGQAWHDAAPLLTAALPCLWRCERRIAGAPAVGDAVADNWSAPVIVGRWGADGADGQPGATGADGADGADAAGYEYVFTRSAGSALSSGRRPSNGWGYDSPGTRGGQAWYDAAPQLTAALPHLWRAERRIAGTPAVGDAVADAWSVPKIVGRFGPEGPQGPAGAAGPVFGRVLWSGSEVSTVNPSWGSSGTGPWVSFSIGSWDIDDYDLLLMLASDGGAASITGCTPPKWSGQYRNCAVGSDGASMRLEWVTDSSFRWRAKAKTVYLYQVIGFNSP